MKNTLTIMALMILAVSSLTAATSPGDLPAALSGIEGAKPEKYFKKIKDIPNPVKEAFGKAMPNKEFNMADSGGAWNKTDIVTNPSLPFRRLIWAVEIKGYYVIHYEMGGRGYSTHYLIAASDGEKEKWFVFWSAAAFEIARDYPAFITDLKKGKLDTNPRLIH